MPEVTRPLTHLGTPARRTRRHWFGGSLIPKRPQDEADVAPLRAVYPEGLAASWADLPPQVAPGAQVTLEVEVENREAGHMLPTGDPERFLIVRAEVRDAGGALLAAREERIGTVYQWEEPVTKLADTRLAPRERRRLPLSFTAPAAGPLTLTLTASKWRISAENMAYHQLEGRTVPGRVFLETSARLEVR